MEVEFFLNAMAFNLKKAVLDGLFRGLGALIIRDSKQNGPGRTWKLAKSAYSMAHKVRRNSRDELCNGLYYCVVAEYGVGIR